MLRISFEVENIFKNEAVYFFPASHNRPYQIEIVDNANVLMRAETVPTIQSTKDPFIIVSHTGFI